MIRSGVERDSQRSATSPFCASCSSWPAYFRTVVRSARAVASSSTIRISMAMPSPCAASPRDLDLAQDMSLKASSDESAEEASSAAASAAAASTVQGAMRRSMMTRTRGQLRFSTSAPRSRSKPLASGRPMSDTMSEAVMFACHVRSHPATVPAQSTSSSNSSRMLALQFLVSGASSTTRTVGQGSARCCGAFERLQMCAPCRCNAHHFQQRFDLRDEGARIDGLGDVRVEAGSEHLFAVPDHRERGERHQRYRLEPCVGLESRGDRVPVEPGRSNVADHQVGSLARAAARPSSPREAVIVE